MCLLPDHGLGDNRRAGYVNVQDASGAVVPLEELTTLLTILENNHTFHRSAWKHKSLSVMATSRLQWEF